FGGAATDVNDHVAHGFFHVDADTHGGSHRLMHQVHLFGAGNFGRVAHGAFFHFSDARWDTDNHPQRREKPTLAVVDHLYHATNHVFGGIEIGNYTVFQRPHRPDVVVRFSLHLHGLAPYRNDLVGGAVKCHNGWLIHHHFVIMDNEGVCRTQINSNLLCKPVK